MGGMVRFLVCLMPEMKTLYIRRDVQNGAEIVEWAKAQGFTTCLAPEKMHVTMAFSKKPVNHDDIPTGEETALIAGGARKVARLGDEGAVVLHVESAALEQRHKDIHAATGAEWSHDGFRPHITLTYQPGNLALESVQPFGGDITLGREVVEEVNPQWIETITEKAAAMTEKVDSLSDVHTPNADGKKPRTFKDYWDIQESAKSANLPVGKAQIIKLHEEERMVTGWASVIEENGVPVIDHQEDVMTEKELVKSAHGFMRDYRASKAMHEGGKIGEVVESVVFTKDLQQALGIDLGKIGWLIKVHVTNDLVWKRVKKGELRSFSIGGYGRRVKF